MQVSKGGANGRVCGGKLQIKWTRPNVLYIVNGVLVPIAPNNCGSKTTSSLIRQPAA